MKLGFKKNQRERPVVIEVLDSEEEEEPTCTFDDDADPSIERCWEPTDGNFTTSNKVIGGHPLALAGTGAAVVAALLVVGSLMRKQVKSRKTSQVGDVATNADADDAASNSASVHSKAGASVHSKAASVASKSASIVKGQLREVEDAGSVQSRVKELKSSLEREAKEKENLFNQNNFLKSALEERKATVQMFTSELQSRDEQLANFEQEQVKVKEELYKQIEALKKELQTQEKLQAENLNNMDGQCANLAGKVEGLMEELASREEQWEKFEKEAKAKEGYSAAQVEAIKKEYAAKEHEQQEGLVNKKKECADLSNQLESLSKEMKESEVQLSTFARQRQKWKNATVNMTRMLQEKQEEIAGLNTRMELFMSELKSREERLNDLESKLEAKNDLTQTELEDLRISIKEQREDSDVWSKKTSDIEAMLGVKQEEAQDLTVKVESLTKELQSTSEKVTALEAKVQDKEFVILANKESMEKQLQDEQEQRSQWTNKHAEMSRLLKARQDEFDCLTARVEIFAAELQTRETIVEELQAKANEKEKTVAEKLSAFEKEFEGKKAFRDTWSESTKGINDLLERKKEAIVGLTTRLELFQVELKKREERVASLRSMLKERQDVSNATLEPYQTQLKVHQADLDKWKNSTQEIRDLMESRKGECIGLTTRLNLFTKKLEEYDSQVDELTKNVDVKLNSCSSDILPLQDTLRKQQEERDSWQEKTSDIGKQLRDRQGECSGLKTRLDLFRQQTKFHQEQVDTLSAKAVEIQERFDLQIVPLKKELAVQTEGLESWRESTAKVEGLMKQAEKDIVDLTEELKVHIAKLKRRQTEVAALQSKVSAKEDAAISQEDFYLKDREKEVQERDNWAGKTKELERLLGEKEGQIVGLSTRLSLFESELATRQTTVSTIEANFTETKSAFQNKISSLENELQFQREQRDHCLESTLSMNKAMKEIKEPCFGLSTRLTLFKKELEGREERVKVLGEQVREKTENALVVLEPLRKELKKQKGETEKWNNSTLDVFWMLKERRGQIVGLSTRLELFMSELQNKEDAVEAAESKLKDIVAGLAEMDNLNNEIKVKEEQRRKWQNSTYELSTKLSEVEQKRTLNTADDDVASLSAKLELFRGQLKRCDEKVESMQTTVIHRRETLTADKGSTEKKIAALKEDRDSWMEKTLEINSKLKSTQNECVGLTTRWELFKQELNMRKESVSALEAKLQEKEQHFDMMVNPYHKELQVQTDLRDKWLETIEKMNRLLKKKESECINFTTQLESAIDELTSRKEQVARLETSLANTKEIAESRIESLQKQLAEAQEGLSNWTASTDNIKQLLKEKRQGCASLQVRLQVFRRQVETQDSRIAMLEAAYQAKQNEVTAQVDDLQGQLREQQSARDESVSATLSINQAIKEKELQCAGIAVRLSLFRTELESREKNVSVLATKLIDCEDLSALQVNPVKAQLQTQKDELVKWAKNTEDIQRLFNKRSSERVGLATRLGLFQSQLKTIEESVSSLEARLQKRKQAAATELTPYKNALDSQKAERDRWSESTKEIQRLLQDRRNQILGLKTRFALFKKEVKHREDLVASIQAKLEEKEAEIDENKLEPVRKELEAHEKERDNWAETTAGIQDMLKATHNEINGLNTRLACFTIELQKREEVCSILAKQYAESKELFGSQVEVLKSELAMQVEQRDKWRETTAEMRQQVADRKGQCNGLTTRVQLFQKEIEGHDEAIVRLKSKLSANDVAVAEIEELKNELKVQQDHRNALNMSLCETEQLLNEKKAQCAGLQTRLVVFRQQLKERMDRLASTEDKAKEKEDLSASRIESLQLDLQAQREQRDKWTETTNELKTLLEEKETQCSLISAELELLAELQT